MSKEARELLKKINDKKNEIRGLQGQGKTKEMQDHMQELRDMQAQFDILMELDDDDGKRIKDGIGGDGTQVIEGAQTKKEKKISVEKIKSAFVSRIVCGLRRRQMPEADKEVWDMMTEADPSSGESDGGFTVPQDISTEIKELRRAGNDLEQYVNVERVTTMSGSRVIEKDADSTPWADVDEGEAFPDADTPKFLQIKYKIGKKGGILKTTYELLQDTAENILAYLNKWIAKKSRATRNAAILKVLDAMTASKEVAVTGFDDLKDVFNVKLDPAIAASSIVLTNQDGFNYLDKLKDSDGNYIMQKDVTDATKMLLFGRYPVIRVSNKVLKSAVVAPQEEPAKDGSETYPLYIGDLKEAATLFDREKISIELSTEAGDLWAKDLTGIKVRDRFDVQPVDKSAVVKGEITIVVKG